MEKKIEKKELGSLTVSEYSVLMNHILKKIKSEKDNKFSNLLVSRKEIAQLFRVSITTVNNWSRKSKLPKEIVQGGRIYYLRTDIENLLSTSI